MEGSTPKLIVVQGPQGGETLEVKPGTEIQIGRVVRGNTLPIEDAGISSKHLSVDFDSGKWVIRDLDSSNGTLLNDSKLPSFTPFDLGDGDHIKIGEYTSIMVKIEVQIEDDGESRLRRNPGRRARQAAVKDVGSENVGSVAKNRCRRGGSKRGKGLEKEYFEHNLVLINENCDEELKNVGLVVENRGRRVGSRRGKGLKDEDNEVGFGNVGSVAENPGRRVVSKKGKGFIEEDSAADLDLVGGKCDGELENVVVVSKIQRGRGRPKKGRVLNNEAAEDLCEVQNLEGKGNVSHGVEESGQQVILRTTRSSKNEEQSVSDSTLQKIPGSSSLDCRQLEIEDKRMQRGLRRKRNLGNEALEVVEVGVSEHEGLELQDEASEAVELVVSEEKENMEVSDLGQDICKESPNGSGIKESFIEVSNEVDLGKMTLGEWFDYLEVHLPKQICDVTEEMIASMREKDDRFREFLVQQQNEKGKLPVG